MQSLRPSTARLLQGLTCQKPLISRSFHKDYNPSLEDQTFKLSDKRTMGFSEYGNLTGTPAFFFHGAPGSRYDGVMLHTLAKKLNIRIICPDRPGHGLSTFQPGRKIGDYPKDISQLAQHLGTIPYHVVGISGGGPYAIACAHSSPKNELLNTAVIAGIGPPEILTLRKAGLYTVFALKVNKYLPFIPRYGAEWIKKDEKRFQNALDTHYKYMTADDRAEVDTPEERKVLTAILKAAYAQGADGAIRDAQLYGTKWDFQLEDVKRKVLLFYGGRDTGTPVVFGRYFRATLERAELVVFEEASHWTIQRHFEEIWTKLLNDEQAKRGAREVL